jgi:hypothetical protein
MACATALTAPFFACTSDAVQYDRLADPLEYLRAVRARLMPDSGSGSFAGVIIHASGRLNQSAELQGRRPGQADTSRFREAIALLAGGGVAHEYEHHRVDGTSEWVREVYEEGAKTIHILADGVSVRLTDGPEVSGLFRIRRRLPHVLLDEAIATASSTVELVSSAERGDAGPAIIYRRASGPPLTLTFAESDTTLRGVAYSATLPGLGDATVRWTFGDYRSVPDRGTLPHSYEVTIAGARFLSMQVDSITLDAAATAAFAAAPPGFDLIEVPTSGRDASA